MHLIQACVRTRTDRTPQDNRSDHVKKQVLFIDDEPSVLSSLQRMLRRERRRWEMVFLDSPRAALDRLNHSDCDAVVTDFQMPGMNGLQLLERLRQQEKTRDLPVIVLTGAADRSIKRKALDLGATDLLNKPVDGDDLVARVRSAIRLKTYQDELKCQNSVLEQKVRTRTRQLEASRLDILWRLGKAAEYRDEQTGNHVVRVGYYSRVIANAYGADRDFVDRLFFAAPLHDIGKIGIPDSILLKTGKLTDDEWHIMKQHCEFGADILQQQSTLMKILDEESVQETPSLCECADNPVLDLAATIALTHHEKWNGGGYPNGLIAEAIALAGRIVAVSDVFDALTSARPYKQAFSEERAVAIMEQEVGRQFDPAVYAAFDSSIDDIRTIRDKFADVPCVHRSAELPVDAASNVSFMA